MRKGWLGLREALGLLTILPVTSAKGLHRLSPEEMGRAMVWFPPVGAGIGAFAALIWLLASWLWPEPIPAALGLTTWVAVTGALHLDGFADTVDGLAAWKGPQETLQIMQDSRIGAIGAVGLFITGFLKEVGKDSWLALKGRLFPKAPEPIQVATNFEPVLYDAGSCSWVPEVRLYEKEAEGYTYYPHPNRGAKCFRIAQTGHGPSNEFLMARPDAKKKGT